jgi:hypothetical protein
VRCGIVPWEDQQMITVERLVTISINGPEVHALKQVCGLAKLYIAANKQSVTVLSESTPLEMADSIVPGLTAAETTL